MRRTEQKTDLKKRPEIRALTSVRWLAALLVFVYHHDGLAYGTRAANPFVSFIQEGHIGVTIFFVLSGFLITTRYMENFRARTQSIYTYVTNRIARIYPLYYFLLIVFFAIKHVPAFTVQTIPLWTLTQGYLSTP